MLRVLRLALFSALCLALIAAALFRLSGGRWMNVTTPSMGQTAPVGTLLLVRPDPEPKVGQFVIFHPPGRPGETYAHRLVAEHAGVFQTRGDANGAADPWTLPAGAVNGRVVARLWWLGWLLRLAPYLLIVGAVTLIVGRLVPRRHRLAAQLLAGSAGTALTIMLVRPFVQLVVLVNIAVDGQSSTTVVPTGLMPVSVHALHGSSAQLKPGQIGTLHSNQTGADGHYHVSFLPHLTYWWWLITIIGWALPLIIAVSAGAGQDNARTAPAAEGPESSDSDWTILPGRPAVS